MPPDASTAEFLDDWSAAGGPVFLRSLDRLRINVGGGTTLHPGNNPVAMATQDTGLEFAKHRPYTPGDDLRHIDWNALARHDTKLIKTFRAEREAPLHLLIDNSASMAAPVGDRKPMAAAALAMCLAYISLRNRDPVRVAAIGDAGARHIAPLLRHPQRLPLLAQGLASLQPSGTTDIEGGVAAYVRTTRLPGVAVVLSDFLVPPANYQPALHSLLASRYSVAAIRLIGPEEQTPRAQSPRVRLVDVESKRERIVDLTPAHRARYQEALGEHTSTLHSWCKANGIPFCVVDTGLSPRIAITRTMTSAGVLR